MPLEYRADDWDQYEMDYHDPYKALEPLESEIAVVDDCLHFLKNHGAIAHTDYPPGKLLLHRRAVQENFEVAWTAITPRMGRLLYALNAIARPRVMIAAGVFCGFTFISNAGAAAGPGACYAADQLIGLEINEEHADQARRNVRRLDGSSTARIVAEDAVAYCADFDGPIDLLYLDADGDKGRGKRIYLEILQAAYDQLPPGALVLAHNSVNCADQLDEYFQFVRDPEKMATSVNAIIDPEGLEVSVR